MWFTRVSLKNPVFATMVMLAFVVMGLFAFQKLKVDQFPNIDLPVVVVLTEYPGASPEIVESEVSKKIEESVKEIIKSLKTKKEIKTDKTFNKYNFVGNTKRPFDLAIWLCPKSVPEDNGTPGFFFYETQDGYNFKSANNLLTGGGGIVKEVYTQKETRDNPGNKKIILKY